MKFKDQFITEGTTAAIIVKIGNSYSMSYAQYDGYLDGIGGELMDHFYSQKDAEKLVSPKESGEIRGILNGKIEFYPTSDRKEKLLINKSTEKAVIKAAKNFGNYIYFWDGDDWGYAKGTEKITSLSRDVMNVIMDMTDQ